MMTEHLNLTFVMIWSLALANVAGALICLGIANHVAKLTNPLFPPGAIHDHAVFFAAFQATRDWQDLIALLIMGTLAFYEAVWLVSAGAADRLFLAPRLEPGNLPGEPSPRLGSRASIVIILLLLTVADLQRGRILAEQGKT